MKQSTAEVVAHVNSTHGTSYQLVRRLAGGMQSGAFELSDGSSKVVLKWSEDPGWAHRVFRAAELVRKARAAGYPTPAWLAVGTTSAGSPYQLQEYIDGTPLVDATSLDLDVAEQLAGVDEFFFEAALRAGGRASAAICAAAGYASTAAFVGGIGPSPVSRVQLGAERLLHLLEG